MIHDYPAEVAAARRIIKALDASSINYGLGLYAALRVLHEENQAAGRSTTALIIGRNLFKEQRESSRFEIAACLKIGDTVLGVMGEEGWSAVCRAFAEEKGQPDFFVSLACEFLQRPDQSLQWNENEQEEVESEIRELVGKIRAGLTAQTLDVQTPATASIRQLKARL